MTAIRVVALAAIVLDVAAGCGDDGDGRPSAGGGAVDVRSFEEVQASDMVFEADPSDPTRAIIRVSTAEPMICAIVWCTDDSYGRFNNSLSMDGTGVEKHDVIRPEIEPGTESFTATGGHSDEHLSAQVLTRRCATAWALAR